MEFAAAPASALICAGLCFGQAAATRNPEIASPTAIATNAEVTYCFARVRGLDPSREPQAYLVVRLRATVSYRNAGTRPVILPLEHTRIIYSGFKPEGMKVFKEGLGLLDPVLKVMKELPPDVSPNSPVSPKNDVFGVIPAGGEMTPPRLEEITLPVNRKGVFRQYPDLRGHRVFVKLQFAHQELAAALLADLSDRWSLFGVPWAGSLTTNVIAIDVPAAPQAAPCKDIQTPAHPVVGVNDAK